VSGSCVTSCSFAGDCDPGFLCVNKACLPSCELDAPECPDGLPCTPSGLQGAGFCGTSQVATCLSELDCPDGYACLGTTCVETCERDADCPPREACFERGGFGRCFVADRPGDFDRPDPPDAGADMAPPNNIPTVRECRGRPTNYCPDTFGEDERCIAGTCRIPPSVFVVLDVSAGESCQLPGDAPDAAGVDIVGVEDESGDPEWASVVDVVTTEGGYVAQESIALADTDACGTAPVSTGCGGWITLETLEPLSEGRRLTVYERGDNCEAPVLERYRLYVCTDRRAVTLSRDLTSCTILMGEGNGQRTFTIAY
jgi:hypothetical protein